MNSTHRPRRTRSLFIVLAWLSLLPSGVALIFFWMSLIPTNSRNEILPQGDRHAFTEAKRKSEDAFHLKAAVTVAICAVGVALAIVGLFGIRTGRGAAFIIPGACLGILAALFVTFVVVVIVSLAGIKV